MKSFYDRIIFLNDIENYIHSDRSQWGLENQDICYSIKIYTDYNFYSKVIISYGIFEISHYLWSI